MKVVLVLLGSGLLAGGMNVTADDELIVVRSSCFNCIEECGNGSHYDELPGPGSDGTWDQGTFVNMCGIAYSECWEYHFPCPPGDSDEVAFTEDRFENILHAVRTGSPADIARLLREYTFAELHVAESALRIMNCQGEIYANVPMPAELSAEVAADL